MAISAVQAIAGVSQASKARKATKSAVKSAQQGPQRGLDLFFDMEERMGGVPDISDAFVPAEFRTLTDEDYDRLEQSIFESRTALFMEPFEESLRAIQGEEERRGISSLGAEQRFRLAARTGDMLRAEAAGATTTALQARLQEQGMLNELGFRESSRETAFNLSPLDVFFNRGQLATSMTQTGATAGANAGQFTLSGFGQQADIIGSSLKGMSTIFGLSQASGALGGGSSDFVTEDLRLTGGAGR